MGLEELLGSDLPILPAEPDQEAELEVDQPEAEAGQDLDAGQDLEPVEDSAPEGEQDGEIAVVDGGEPGGGTVPGAEAESEVPAEVTAEDPEPVPSEPDQEAELEVDQPEAEAGQDLDAGQDLEPVEDSAPFKDAGGSSLASSVVLSSQSHAQVRIAGLDHLFGTGRDDRIRGSRRAEFVVGRRGGDELTGGNGPDRFGFRWGDSQIGALDRITDFTFGEDKIALLDRQGRVQRRPHRFGHAGDNRTARTLQQLAADVFADADGRLAGKQRLRQRSAVVVKATNRKIRGTYLLINDTNAGLNLRNDLIVNIRGFSGDLPAFGRIDPGAMFG